MPIFKPAAGELTDFVENVLADYHKHLVDADVIVDVLEARPKTNDEGDPIEESLKLHGYPCLATIKVRPPKERAEGRGDALLTIDAFRWPELDTKEKTALIDHELTHLELRIGDEGSNTTITASRS